MGKHGKVKSGSFDKSSFELLSVTILSSDTHRKSHRNLLFGFNSKLFDRFSGDWQGGAFLKR